MSRFVTYIILGAALLISGTVVFFVVRRYKQLED